MSMRAIRISATLASRCVPVRGYAAASPKPETGSGLDQVEQGEPEAESSTAAQRRLLRLRNTPAPPETTVVEKPKKRRGPSALALIRARKLAEALKDSPPPSNSTIPLSTSMTPSPHAAAPTLEDLEHKRPARAPPTLLSPKYPRQYNDVYSRLDVAFTAKQLYKLAPKLGVRVPRGKSKALVIRGILGTWGWRPPLTTAQQDELTTRRETEVVERDWTLTKAELWLLMQDTEGLGPALEQGVKFSLPPTEGTIPSDGDGVGDMRVLRGTGGEESLAELDRLIGDRRQAISVNTRSFRHPDSSGSFAGLISVIANASSAHVEPLGAGEIRVSALSAENLDKAISLLGQALQHSTSRVSVSKGILAPTADLELGLYPHMPAPNGSVPWYDIAQSSKPLFRLRRIQPWEAKVGPRETVHIEEKLDDMTFAPVGESVRDDAGVLSGAIAQTVGAGDEAITTIRFGHVVYPNHRSEGSPLTPPVNASWTAAKAASSQMIADTPVFLPSLPPSLIHFPLEEKLVVRRELRYRNDDGRVLELSSQVPAPASDAPASEREEGWHKELDEYMDKLNLGQSPVREKEEIVIRTRVSLGQSMDVLMPDRPIDFNVSATAPDVKISADLHSKVSTYLQSPTALPPQVILHDGIEWHLLSARELDVTEADLSTRSDDLGVHLDLSSARTTLRTVKSIDLTFGPSRSVRYAELETEGEPSPKFWAEMARVTRVLAPGAGVLRAEIY